MVMVDTACNLLTLLLLLPLLLLFREYLERDKDNPQLFKYLA